MNVARRCGHVLAVAALAAVLAALVAACATGQGSIAPPTKLPSDPGPTATSAQPPATPGGPTPNATDPGEGAPHGTWARLEVDGASPAAREDHTWTVAEDGRTAWLFGGRDGATELGDVWSFDMETEAWSRHRIDGPSPAARFGHEAAWLPGHGLLVWAGQAGAEFFDDAWVLDPGGQRWDRLDAIGDVPVARYGSCSGIGPDGRFWISHGFTANGIRFDDTAALDVEAARWSRVEVGDGRPIKRCLHACWWTPDGRLALFGGQTNGVPALGDLWFLEPTADGAAGAWQETPDQRAPERQLAAVAQGDGITVIAGGRGTDGAPLADSWFVTDGGTSLERLEAPAPPPARSGAAMVFDAAADRMVLFGGLGDRALDDLWELALR